MGSKKEEATKVLITGFGPFEGHPVNASWEAVQELSNRIFPEDMTIHTKQVPVSYNYIKEELGKLEREIKPDLIIHVGVSGVTSVIQIEKCAHSTGYCRYDVDGECLPDESSIKPECLETSLDISELRMFCDKHSCCCVIEQSHDAGRYLCEYIYHTSLKANIAPTIFVHVPCLDAPYSKSELADALKLIVLAAVNQIRR